MTNTMQLLGIISFAIAISLASCMAQGTPTISHITQEQIKDIGSMVELECSVQYAIDYPVYWIKVEDDLVILSAGNILVTKDSRFAIRHDPDSSTFKLQIKDIREADAGIYQCRVVITVVHSITDEVKLSVRRPPIISNNSTKTHLSAE